MKWSKRILSIFMMSLLLLSLLSVTAFAAETGDVAGAVEDTWNAARGQIKDVVNKVVFLNVFLLLHLQEKSGILVTENQRRKGDQIWKSYM